MKSKSEEIEQLKTIFNRIRAEVEPSGYIAGIFSDDLLNEMVEDIQNDICYYSYKTMRQEKLSRIEAISKADEILIERNANIMERNAELHALDSRLFKIKDEIRRLAFAAEKKL